MTEPERTLGDRLQTRLRRWFGRATIDLALGLYARFQASRLPVLAAALAYYAAFSLGPLLLLLAGWLGVVLQTRPDLGAQYQQALVDLLEQVLPLQIDSVELVDRSFTVIVDQLAQGALLRTVISLAVLLWAASNFFASLQLALELIFDVPEARGFWRKRLVAVLSVVVVAAVVLIEVVGGLLVSSLGRLSELALEQLASFNVTLPIAVDTIDLGGGVGIEILRLALAAAAFTICFRWLPRRGSSWAGALLGGLFSTAGILLMRQILLASFDPERFNLVYGVITGLLAILLWLYLALLLFLLGALLAAEVSALRRRRGGEGGPGGAARPSPPGELGAGPTLGSGDAPGSVPDRVPGSVPSGGRDRSDDDEPDAKLET